MFSQSNMEATAQLQHLSISAKVMVHFADTVFPVSRLAQIGLLCICLAGHDSYFIVQLLYPLGPSMSSVSEVTPEVVTNSG